MWTLQNKANIWDGQVIVVYNIYCKTKILEVPFGPTDASCA